jgi:hypothetical protein
LLITVGSGYFNYLFIYLFQNKRITGSGFFLTKIRFKGIVGFGYFKNLKELVGFSQKETRKEPAVSLTGLYYTSEDCSFENHGHKIKEPLDNRKVLCCICDNTHPKTSGVFFV